ncbi:hypothetical protein [Streptomyces sp. NPDC096311]|uniref:hypothetical protein n=1 Tax=Streptomyces sp. NPDC096311 TaxID=3366083 RepID=UPI0037FEF114
MEVVGSADGDLRVESEEELDADEVDDVDDVDDVDAEVDDVDEVDEVVAEESVPLLELDEPVPVALPLAVVSASACIVPTRAKTPAAAASVTAAAAAAVRRAPLRTAAAAPRSLPVMAAPLRMTLCHVLRSGSSLREVCEAALRLGRSL